MNEIPKGQKSEEETRRPQISSHFSLSTHGIADQPQSVRRLDCWNVIFYYTEGWLQTTVRSLASDLRHFFAVVEVVGPDRE
ncbi:hypothetical protein HNY73_003409 [Argiope bruennichi]|uniref:Uncharacterized protein n=1 Tax=Argiope bruennichi TaxID=94029 RepID=A0A8T0FKG6_ARGBR|nr:hypothetical protein HNY73_003409 [Argiope bruennichi]